MRPSRLFLSTLLLVSAVLGVARSASAQFQITVQGAAGSQVVSNGSNVNFVSSEVGQTVQLTVKTTYTGTGTAVVSGAQLFGATAFTLNSPGAVTLNPGESAFFTVAFTPTSGAQISATLNVSYIQTVGTAVTSGTISLSLTGLAPQFILGYAIQPQGNAVPLSNGATITFPPTVVGATTTALLTIANTGSAPGVLNSLTVSGTGFQVMGLPLLPGTINNGQALQISILYNPQAVEMDSGTLQLAFPGQNVNLNLAGSGISSQLQFQLTAGTQTLPVSQNQVALPDTVVGSNIPVAVTVTNAGNASATVNAISLTGSGFQLVNVPPLPLTILPNASINLAFTFTPPSSGIVTGYLAIGGTTLTITAKGLGPLYQYSYTTGSSTSTIAPNGSVFFATAQLSQSSSTTFTILNTGTAAGTISGIFIGEANSPFVITGLPSFPLTLNPNQSISFTITFTPTTVASVSGTLHVDATVFGLNGAGGTPPAFPSYLLTGPQGTLGPLQQPAIGLSLSAPYPLPVTGTLTMNVTPNGFTADPAIQFATGGKTVAFSIPANGTTAVFANGNSSIELQTGSTSGTITLTPAFQTASGVALTPASSQNLQLVVPPTAPLLIGAQVVAQGPNGFTLAISGVSNSQTLTELNFTFTAAAGFSLTGATENISVASAAAAWFTSAAAQQFGGQFVATIPFSFASGTTSVTTPATAVTSVSITAANAQGTSASLVVAVP